ncbi:hypothetical protein AAFF_G00113680 [Aldrovandia affinis]|uniref:Uncharacterized protein n=1 Tax=Aldrovandia affinis TaxID=143900 RepID=A0AAD7RT49_9TELE|nr:hypothetical protein AAFF_G00113680 [Aldrovandia affinis]
MAPARALDHSLRGSAGDGEGWSAPGRNATVRKINPQWRGSKAVPGERDAHRGLQSLSLAWAASVTPHRPPGPISQHPPGFTPNLHLRQCRGQTFKRPITIER